MLLMQRLCFWKDAIEQLASNRIVFQRLQDIIMLKKALKKRQELKALEHATREIRADAAGVLHRCLHAKYILICTRLVTAEIANDANKAVDVDIQALIDKLYYPQQLVKKIVRLMRKKPSRNLVSLEMIESKISELLSLNISEKNVILWMQETSAAIKELFQKEDFANRIHMPFDASPEYFRGLCNVVLASWEPNVEVRVAKYLGAKFPKTDLKFVDKTRISSVGVFLSDREERWPSHVQILMLLALQVLYECG